MEKKRIEYLESKIAEASNAYYTGDSIMSDNEFDEMVEELRQSSPNSTVLNKTGWGYTVDSTQKVPHPMGKIGGIDTKIRPGAVAKYVTQHAVPDDAIITSKLDGISALMYYTDGNLQLILTRGDGECGLNITDKLRSRVPNKLNNHLNGYVRGEVIMPKKTWDAKHPNEPSARNFVAGLMTRKDTASDDINDCDVVCYTMVDKNKTFVNASEMLSEISAQGFKTVKYIPTNREKLNFWELDEITCAEILHGLDKNDDGYECDGLVVKTTDIDTQFAIKWNTVSANTEVESIVWQVSRNGKLTPVVQITPVEIAGATISRVTAHNYQYVFEHDLGLGSKITICRSGDVIPYIIDVMSPGIMMIPPACPVCGGALKIDGVHLVCTNTSECSAQAQGQILYFVEKVCNVDGVSESLINKIIQAYNIKSIEDFVKWLLNVNTFTLMSFCNRTPGLGKSAMDKITQMATILRGNTLTQSQVICGLGLKSLSDKTLEKVFEKYESIDNIEKALSICKSLDVEGISYVANISFVENMQRIKSLFSLLPECPKPTIKSSNPQYNINVCITGSLSESRFSFLKKCSQYGIKESTIAKADILVTNNTESGTSKNEYAKAHNKKVMSEAEFRSIYFEQK